MAFFCLQLALPLSLCLAQGETAPAAPAAYQQAADAQPRQAAVPAQTSSQEKKGMNMLQLIGYGGIVGYTIIALSFVAVALAIEYAYTIRPAKLAPAKDIAVIKKIIREGKVEEFQKMDQRKMSYLTRVVVTGLNDLHFGYDAMIKAMEDTSEMLNARIARKVEHLNLISNIAPMLGLLGTVTGMLRCFNSISQIRGTVEPQMLAQGIFEALVTTVEGLIVGIPALYLFAIFRNRVDEFTGQASLVAEELVASFKPSNSTREG
jgi:biopolymer transport protein ExbB